MASFPEILPFLALLFLAMITYIYKRIIKNKTNKLVPPEPSGSLPFIGHLHLLRARVPMARILGKMANRYGPIFSLRLGTRRALVVSDWQMVKDCFGPNDRCFASRPDMAVSRYVFYDNAGFGLAPFGPYWRKIRKLVFSDLFTSQALEKRKDSRNSEVNSFIHELCLLPSDQRCTIEINKWFEQLTFNMNIRMLVGKRSGSIQACFEGNEEDKRVKDAIKKALYLTGVSVVSDFIPSLEWMDIGGHIKAMKEVGKELDSVVRKWFDEHVENRNGKEADFMDVMLKTLEEEEAEMFGHRREAIIKATTTMLVFAGSESIAETLTWALSLLLNHPKTMKAAQNELDIQVGRQKWVEEPDIKKLRYLQAVVKETLRMYPPGALLVPHKSIEDCSIGGYHISKGTRLIVNAWKLHRDPHVWSGPHEFQPERFFEEHCEINYQGQNFEYVPFSSGRRMCPATTYATQIVHLTLARLLQGFDISTPKGKPVDMTEGLGLSLPKMKPLEVIITPRLSRDLY